MEILNLTHNKMDQLLAMKLEFQFFLEEHYLQQLSRDRKESITNKGQLENISFTDTNRKSSGSI